MIDMEKSASAHLPASGVWLQLGEGVVSAAASGVRGMNRYFQRSLSTLERAMARRAARRELYALGDRLLQDIGLRRDQVEETVDTMFRRGPGEAIAKPSREVIAGSSEGIAAVSVSNDPHYKSVA